MRTFAGLLMLGALAVFLSVAGCKVRKQANESDIKFAVLGSATNSILKTLHEQNGKLDVCLGMVGFTDAELDQAAKFFERSAKTAVGAFYDALADHPDWRTTPRPELTFNRTRARCVGTLGVLSISVWKDKEQFKTDRCTDDWACSSHSVTQFHEIVVGPINRGVEETIYNDYTILHEFGHLAGLGDTYKIPRFHDWNGEQPASLMNGKATTIQDDDRKGLWAMWQFLKTGTRSCDGFGREVEMSSNVWQSILCDPEAEAVVDHGPALTPTNSVLTPTGPILTPTSQWLCGNATSRVRACVKTDDKAFRLKIDGDGSYGVWATTRASNWPGATDYIGTFDLSNVPGMGAPNVIVAMAVSEQMDRAMLYYRKPSDTEWKNWSSSTFPIAAP